MKTKLTEEEKKFIIDNYPWNIARDMIEGDCPEIHDYMERAGLSYAAAWFNAHGIRFYEKNGEIRRFSVGCILEDVPLKGEDAEGDWRKWLKGAKVIKEIKGWK